MRRAAAMAAAAAFGAVMMQAWMQNNADPLGAEMASGSSLDAAFGSVLTVRFAEAASIAAINAALRDAGLVIVDGPSAAGLYRLSGLDGDVNAQIAAELRARVDLFDVVDDPE